jgi:hypothetical protein
VRLISGVGIKYKRGIDMPSKLYYKIITSVGEESIQNNIVFDKLENMVQV